MKDMVQTKPAKAVSKVNGAKEQVATKARILPQATGRWTEMRFLCVAAVLHVFGMLYVCHLVYRWDGSRVAETDGTSRYIYQDSKGLKVGVPVEAASLMRIALALESATGTGPTTPTSSPLQSSTKSAQLSASAAK